MSTPAASFGPSIEGEKQAPPRLSKAAAAVLRSGLTLWDTRRDLARRHLRDFTRQAWAVVEPGRPLVGGWHLDAMAEHLEALALGQIRDLVVNIPPRMAKSLSTMVFFPAWTWIEHPEWRWLCSSYAHTLALRDSVKCRRLIESPWYQERWGERFQLSSDQNEKRKFENDRGGFRLATSVDGANTGEGADFIGVDDPISVDEADSEAARVGANTWWDEVMATRRDDIQTGRRLIIMQRIHQDDLTGHALAKESGYVHLVLPMEFEPKRRCSTSIGWKDPRKRAGELLDPVRFPRESVEQLKIDLGPYAAAAQLQQNPTPRGGLMFKREWLAWVPAIPGGPSRAARGWDFAGTKPTKKNRDPDWTVGLKLVHLPRERKFVISRETVRFREEPGDVERRLEAVTAADGYAVRWALYQDPAQAGKYQVQVFAGLPALAAAEGEVLPAVNLFELVGPLRAQAQVGNVLIEGDPEDPKDPARALVDEICAFPAGSHDDVLAALGAAYHALTRSGELLDYDVLNG